MKLFTVTSAIFRLPDDFCGDAADAFRLIADGIDANREVPDVEFDDAEREIVAKSQFAAWGKFVRRLEEGGNGVGALALGDYDPETREFSTMQTRTGGGKRGG